MAEATLILRDEPDGDVTLKVQSTPPFALKDNAPIPGELTEAQAGILAAVAYIQHLIVENGAPAEHYNGD